MARTALQEQFGEAVDESISAGYAVRQPSGVPGCVRFFILRPTTTGLAATLPSTAAYSRMVGGDPVFTIVNKGVQTMTVEDSDASTIATLAVDEVAQLILSSASTSAGTWVVRKTTGVVVGSALANSVVEINLTLQPGTNVSLRALCDQQGYDGTTAARVIATVADGAVIGSTSNLTTSLETGTFPAGSRVLLTVGTGSYICGKGGNGGLGGSTAPTIAPANGQAGGAALRIDCDTTLINYGKIQGGGGGGGGGAVSGTLKGAGGGGGAGYQISLGGASGAPTTVAGSGGVGGIDAPGYAGGGVTSGAGGIGGAPGAAGGNPAVGSYVGGAAGVATIVNTTGGFTLTQDVSGTIDGAETTV